MHNNTLTKLYRKHGQKLWQQFQGSSFCFDNSSTQRLLILSVNPDTMFFTRRMFFNSFPRSSSLVKSDIITAPHFSTTTKRLQLNSETVSSKLIGQEIFPQAPTKFFTRKAEEETIKIEGIGWAGQPIIKRQHTILPEVPGDVCDILKAAKKSKIISEHDNNLEIQVRNFGRSHDIIAVINENAQNKINENSSANETRGRILHTKKGRPYYSHPGIYIETPKILKKKKRTVVLASKPAIIHSLDKSKKLRNRRAKIKKNLMTNKSHGKQLPMVFNRQLSTMPLLRHFLHVENRQFKTLSASNHAKAAVAVKAEKKESSLTVIGKSKQKTLTKSKPEATNPDDDCVCPEILYTKGKRKSTKICGEAAGARKTKKKSSWKQKMCLVEPKEDPGRQKTLVCISEAAKQKKHKKDLPKCPEPEKKVAPRVLICEPKLESEEEKKSKKECVKIEEVKIRKRTTVCKPVVIFAKEEVGIEVQKKAVCSSTRVQKVVSRHTKICPPENK